MAAPNTSQWRFQDFPDRWVEGHQPTGGGANLLHWPFFPENCMKFLKQWTEKGSASIAPPRSANASKLTVFFFICNTEAFNHYLLKYIVSIHHTLLFVISFLTVNAINYMTIIIQISQKSLKSFQPNIIVVNLYVALVTFTCCVLFFWTNFIPYIGCVSSAFQFLAFRENQKKQQK